MTASRATGRNRAIDVLRGWAIVLMISSHIGTRSRLSVLINLPLWLDPAGPFVLLSGLVLGMAARGNKPLSSVWRRARQIWFIHVAAMVVVLFVHETTGRLNAPSIADAGGLGAALWKIPTLRLQALDFMNILPLFVVFFAVAPFLILAMRRGAAALCLAGSLGLWLLTQHAPGWWRFTDPACGPEAFILPGWQLPFVLGLVLGFHADLLAGLYRKNSAWLTAMMAMVAGTVFVLAQLQRTVAARFGAHVPDSLEWVFGKEAWGPGRAIYTLSLLGLGYLGVDWVVRRGRAGGVRPLEILGRKSLYSFLVHLPIALLASALNLQVHAAIVQDLAVLSALAVVYLMARYEVFGRIIPN
jgi:hypothetical protein